VTTAGDKVHIERSQDKLALLRNHPLFRDLAPEAIERLGSYMKRRTVARGTTLFAKGDPGSGLMGVLAGTVKISVPSADGRDIVLNLIHAGEIFGEIALLDGQPRTADATAISDCELILIDRRDFIPFLRSQPDLAMQIMTVLCSRLRRTSEQVQDLTFLSLPILLAKTLLRLSADQGSGARPNLTITQREISEMIGRSRESTNKQLRSWVKQGWIGLQRGSITLLRPDKLAEFAAHAELDAT
jgi:CRP/FNR family transcriptional regulator, cyclic AMP receptor protein